MSRRKQKRPKHAQLDNEVMGNDEASCEENITMAEHQCNAKQQQPNIDGSYEQIMCDDNQRAVNAQSPTTPVYEPDPAYNTPFYPSTYQDESAVISNAKPFQECLPEENHRAIGMKNKIILQDGAIRNTIHNGRKVETSANDRRGSPDLRRNHSEYICPACGLYFLNAETYETHIRKYCIALNYLMKTKSLEETLLTARGSGCKKTHREDIDLEHQRIEKLQQTLFRIQQSLSRSRVLSRNSLPDEERPQFISSPSPRTVPATELTAAPRDSMNRPLITSRPRVRNRTNSPSPESTRENSSSNSILAGVNGQDRTSDPISKYASDARFKPASPNFPTEKRRPLHCIVCDNAFSNDHALRHHVLSEHGNKAQSFLELSHSSRQRGSKSPKLAKARRYSTVERPALSQLKVRNAPRLPGMSEEPKELPEIADAVPESYIQLPSSKENSPSNEKSQTQFSIKHFPDDDRRMSCPAVPGMNISLKSFPFRNDAQEEKHCTECDIKFNSVVNYRAHKKFYCAGRHEQRNTEANPYRSTSIQLSEPPPAAYLSQDYLAHNRNLGQQTSVNARKRSHFIPLQSSITPNPDDSANKTHDDEPRLKKPDTKSPNISAQPSQDDSEASPQRRYFCEECKISFSKEDTYVAHKKYYCHTRRKDRSTSRTATPRNPSRKSSRESIERIASPYNALGINENLWRLREGERSTSLGNLFPSENLLANAGLSHLLQQQSLMMGNLAMMHPYLMKQYLAMRERLPPDTSRSTQNSPNLAGFSRDRKLSAGESRGGSRGVYASNPDLTMKSNRRPARQSCTAAINVKQEDNLWDQTHSSHARENKMDGTEKGLPLDLRRNTASSSGDEEPNRSPSSTASRSSRTAAVVEADKANSNMESDPDNRSNGMANSNNNNDKTENASSSKGRNQTCKNCNTQFTSLSTFIAHKKYYCSGLGNALQSVPARNVIVKTETTWGS